ncbi:hypothetical protein MAR_028238 [Mya arenaria]|uniref:Uncharacterized protein n=1 Tax=Mya arenaria TaxID=6604 RepID=A0ABY7DHJ3_MYAAR|nr:uncharacterized protein LOC128225092 [Mya arenaria]WAQ95548.1 hypothetical protein MAR_028238 [Mya arenaria]
MISGRTLSKTGLILAVFSLVLQMLGFSCPGWLIVDIDLQVLSATGNGGIVGFGRIVSGSGLWFVRVCVHGTGNLVATCSTDSEHDTWQMGFRLHQAFTGLQSLDWLEVQIELTLALFFCTVAVLLVAFSLCRGFDLPLRPSSAIAAVLSLISVALILPVIIKVVLVVRDAKEASKDLKNNNGESLVSVEDPWALVLSACGMFLAFVASIVLAISAVLKDERKKPTVSPLSILTPAILRMGNFPARISTKDLTGHLPPSAIIVDQIDNENDGQPAIGRQDTEVLAFRTGRMLRETTEYEFYPPPFGQPTGSTEHLEDTTIINSRPPSYERFKSDLSIITGNGKYEREIEDFLSQKNVTLKRDNRAKNIKTDVSNDIKERHTTNNVDIPVKPLRVNRPSPANILKGTYQDGHVQNLKNSFQKTRTDKMNNRNKEETQLKGGNEEDVKGEDIAGKNSKLSAESSKESTVEVREAKNNTKMNKDNKGDHIASISTDHSADKQKQLPSSTENQNNGRKSQTVGRVPVQKNVSTSIVANNIKGDNEKGNTKEVKDKVRFDASEKKGNVTDDLMNGLDKTKVNTTKKTVEPENNEQKANMQKIEPVKVDNATKTSETKYDKVNIGSKGQTKDKPTKPAIKPWNIQRR